MFSPRSPIPGLQWRTMLWGPRAATTVISFPVFALVSEKTFPYETKNAFCVHKRRRKSPWCQQIVVSFAPLLSRTPAGFSFRLLLGGTSGGASITAANSSSVIFFFMQDFLSDGNMYLRPG